MGQARAQGFRERLVAQTTLAGAAGLLSEFAKAMGWDRAAFAVDKDQALPPRAASGEFLAVRMGWPGKYLDDWVRHSLARACPVTQQCGRTADSFLWESDPDGASWTGRSLAAAQRRVLAFYQDFADGAVTVPVHRPDGRTGYVSWFMRDRRRLGAHHWQTYDATYLCSHSFIRHLDRIGQAKPPRAPGKAGSALTARQLECLRWAAQGKTEEDIGMIIERSPDTVHFHLQAAVTRLNACNRTHAVAIACTRGLIAVL
jgi:DNA-binding CsgD family transcriptional regulator